jgi:hypothetical protein
MRYTETDLSFLARVIGGDAPAAAEYIRAWRTDASRADPWLDDQRVLATLMADDRAILELSPRFLFTILLRRIRSDLATIPYTVERVDSGGRLVVFDAGVVHELLKVSEMFDYLVELLVSFERVETLTVRHTHRRRDVRRLNTLSIDDMMELAGMVEASMRPMVFQRIGDIALFTTGIFPDAIRSTPRRLLMSPLAPPERKRRWEMEDYEGEGRRFYRLAADLLAGSHPLLARVLARLAEDFTIARKPLSVLADRYVAWARPHWRQTPS